MADNQNSELWDSRTRTLLGDEACCRLAAATVMVVGIGGVGGYAAEMLVRSGVGKIIIVDADDVAESNINRQLIALQSTVGQPKTELFARRFADINPDCAVLPLHRFVTPDNLAQLPLADCDFVLDCIDSVAPKVALIEACFCSKIPVISSMGAGGRIDPSKVQYSDLWSTREDGLARAVRQSFKKKGFHPVIPVVCSAEAPKKASVVSVNQQYKKSSFGTLATVPAMFGLWMANYVIRKIAKV